MKGPLVIVEIQRGHLDVIVQLVRSGMQNVAMFSYFLAAPTVDALEGAGGSVLAIDSLIEDADRSEAREIAIVRAREVREHLAAHPPRLDCTSAASSEDLGLVLSAHLEDWMMHSQLILRAFDRLANEYDVRAVVVSAEFSRTQRLLLQWGRERGIPSFHISHGANLGNLQSVYASMASSYILVSGERGGEIYRDIETTSHVVVVGNAKWDVYTPLVARREALRAELRNRFGLPADALIAMYAMSTPLPVTAVNEEHAGGNAVNAFLAACALLRQNGLDVLPLIKDRPSPPGVQRPGFRSEALEMASRLGLDGMVYAMEEPVEPLVVASDIVVGADSNVVLEAAIAGVPPINMWQVQNTVNGPYFGAEDGIPHVDAHNHAALAQTMYRLLTNPDERSRILAGIDARLPYLVGPRDGAASQRAAEFILGVIA